MIAPEHARTALFVPGSRPDRFDKAAASGADLVVLDLEDAVAPDAKAKARTHVESWLSAGHHAAVRVNGAGTAAYAADIQMLRRINPVAVLLPKAEPDGVTALLRELSRSVPVIVLIESAVGVLHAPQLCAMPQIVRAALGHLDLAGDVGCDPESSTVGTAADLLALASAAAGLPGPLDGVCTAIDDDERLRRECDRARRRGYAGKLVIHPNQVPIVRESFAPTATDLEWARHVMASADDGGAVQVDGHMIDEAVLRRARRIIDWAGPGRDL